MKKKFFILSVILLWAILLVGQTLTLDKVGIIAAGGGQTIHLGERVIVYLEYTTSGFGAGGSVECLGYATGGFNNNQLRLYWWNGNTEDSYVYCNVRALNRIISTNGTFTDTVSFVLPTPPSDQNRIRVKFRVFGDADGDGTTVYSNVRESGYNSPSGYYTYLDIDRNVAPVAQSVSITNPEFAKVGQTIDGYYEYNDADGDKEDLTASGTSFRWLRSDSQSGTYSAISGATNKTYTVVQADLGKYLKFEVTPKAATGISQGTTVLSSATNQVTGAPILEFNASYKAIAETSANTGAVSSDTYLRIDATNTSFVSDITKDYITIQNLPNGLEVSEVQCLETSNIRVYLSGNATYHEYAASVNNVKITVDDAKLVGVVGDKQTTNNSTINFINNPPTGLALDSVGNNYIEITWNNPAGLLQEGSGLNYFNILRNEQLIDYLYLEEGKGTYSYTDTNVTNGTHYRYKVQAVYDDDGNPTSIELKGTPLAITAFSFSNPQETVTIDHTNKTIKVVVPYGTNVTSLKATFTAPGAIVKVGTTTQASGSTPNNFSTPVTYTLTTSDSNDASTCSYEVTVYQKLETPSPIAVDDKITTSSIKLQWVAIPGVNENENKYGVDVSDDNSFPPGNSQHKVVSINYCTINDLEAGTKYYFRVQAIAPTGGLILDSDYSNTIDITTLNIPNGNGSTEINSNGPTTIDVSSYDTPLGTVIPKVIVAPIDFTSTGNDIITVTMSYGTSPEGLRYTFAFDNRSIGIGTYVLYYNGLSYDPTDVRYRLNGGDLHTVSFSQGTNSVTVHITDSDLPQLREAAYNLQIVLNDQSGQTLPVVLSSFTATPIVQGKVRLDWVTQSESGLTGFWVLRNTVAEVSTALVVSPLIEATNTSNVVAYTFTDSEIPCNGTYYYWLQIEENGGVITHSATLTVEVTNGNNHEIPIPLITALQNPFPNPFNPSLTIPFDLSKEGRVTIKIYNLRGQLIKNLIDEEKKASSYRVVWDGKDNGGHIVSAGTYIVRMSAPDYNSSRKIVMVK